MKKFACLLLVGLILAASGCDLLEASTSSVEDSSSTPSVSVEEHEHQFLETAIEPTCTEGGKLLRVCECGVREGISTGSALGHAFPETPSSYARLQKCAREGCAALSLPEHLGTYEEQMHYTFDQAERERVDDIYAQLCSELTSAGEYNDALHGYEEGSALHTSYQGMEQSYKAFEGALVDVGAQYQYAQIHYHEDFYNQDRMNEYLEVMQYYNELCADYYGLFEGIAGSAYREYFYAGMSDQEIESYVAQYSGSSSPEVVTLTNRNQEITVALEQMDAGANDAVLDLYEEFVENNQRIAALYGYENYMQYAYTEIYGREYSYTEFDGFYQNLLTYVKPVNEEYQSRWYDLLVEMMSLPSAELEKITAEYDAVTEGSFFEDELSNESVNGFMAKMTTQKAGGETLSFAEKLEEVMKKGNYFLGDYGGAYTWGLEKLKMPILYFGEGYQNSFTVVHEFGHYVNDLYNAKVGQSYDLMETHSQGLEMLYLSDLKNYVSERTYELIKTSKIADCAWLISVASAVNRFEQAVYAGEYDGLNHESIMADGKVTKEEYDLLFESILIELGAEGNEAYWRYVAIPSPAYYVSYAISMVCSMQLYIQAETNSLGSAAEKYLKLIAYTEESEKQWYNYKQVLGNAGMYAYDEEAMFEAMYEYLMAE